METDALKFVAVTVKVPSAAATTGVDVSMVLATLVFPQAALALGLWTSDRLGVPATPRTGAIAACPYACIEKESAITATVTALENISMAIQNGGIKNVR